MMKINWKARLRHKPFIVSLFSLLLLLGNQLAAIFNADFTIYNDQITTLAETILAILVLLGIVIDPTTDGITDSEQALQYTKPRKEGE
ncbi:putative holin, phage associated [Lysinibacillus alkalisoli]|uniref:Holin, phage associated n=1 Tax=Lysinibacillus alkalisoli TaxID=1911548 RepID=A0A917GBC3_9BACI|nr:phage holin [Lysinibacillus alkalisoli]GGG34369.1 putative holin, phage associated [Lysinibacillus alkalisoli]